MCVSVVEAILDFISSVAAESALVICFVSMFALLWMQNIPLADCVRLHVRSISGVLASIPIGTHSLVHFTKSIGEQLI